MGIGFQDVKPLVWLPNQGNRLGNRFRTVPDGLEAENSLEISSIYINTPLVRQRFRQYNLGWLLGLRKHPLKTASFAATFWPQLCGHFEPGFR